MCHAQKLKSCKGDILFKIYINVNLCEEGSFGGLSESARM